jgi:hypothetical protein
VVGNRAPDAEKAPAGAAQAFRLIRIKPLAGRTPSLRAPSLICPSEEACELLAVAPNEAKEFRWPKRVHVTTKKRF